jgi:hypothetical protein
MYDFFGEIEATKCLQGCSGAGIFALPALRLASSPDLLWRQPSRLHLVTADRPRSGSQGANFTAGGRELFASRSREADNSVVVKTERSFTRSLVTSAYQAGEI